MHKKTKNPYLHIAYWVLVLLVLSRTFGLSWGNKAAAFYFVSMLLPIVMGTSYFFNYVLVPKYYLSKRYKRFAFYTFCTAVISVYLEMLVLVYALVYLVNMNFQNLSPNVRQLTLLYVVLYLLVFIGSFLLMMNQIIDHQHEIQKLLDEKEKMKKSFLEVISNRRTTKIPYDDIVYVESLSDYIKIITCNNEIVSKEKISRLSEKLPSTFLRIHRSFIINSDKIKEHTSNDVLVDDVRLNIGRSYRKEVKEVLNNTVSS